MKVVQVEEVERRRGLEHRGGTFHARTMVEGTPGTPGNFKFSLSELGTDYSGPRHRHNFDQLRFILEGEVDFGRDGTLKAGQLGYFPEGVFYGPQVNKTPIKVAIVQFGGASGSGYILPRDIKAGMEELKTCGEFRDGVFHRNEGEGRRNMDAYQAIWEHLNGREMVYPKPRYDAPIFMDTANFDWAPAKSAKGVSEKLFGVWTERRTEAGMLKLDSGARYAIAGRGLYLVISGTGTCEGKPLKEHTTIFLDPNERAAMEAATEMLLLHYGLPDLSGMASNVGGIAQAAE